MSRRVYGLGAAAVIAYVGVAFASSLRGPILPLYDGQAPPAPYRYVDPPEDAQTTERALSGKQEVLLGVDPPMPLNAFTGDSQAVLSGTERAFAPAEGQEAIDVAISPLDPATLGEAPDELVFDGNAYRFEARYRPSGDAAVPAEPVTVVLRYPVHATALLRWTGSAWERVRATTLAAALQIYAQTRELGVYVAAGPAPPTSPWPWVGAGAGVLGLGALVYLRFRMRPGKAGTQARPGKDKSKPKGKPR